MLFALQVLPREIVTVCRCAKRCAIKAVGDVIFHLRFVDSSCYVGEILYGDGQPFFLFWPYCYPSFSHRPSLSVNCPWLYRLLLARLDMQMRPTSRAL